MASPTSRLAAQGNIRQVRVLSLSNHAASTNLVKRLSHHLEAMLHASGLYTASAIQTYLDELPVSTTMTSSAVLTSVAPNDLCVTRHRSQQLPGCRRLPLLSPGQTP